MTYTYHCLRCNQDFESRSDSPAVCKHCKSTSWDLAVGWNLKRREFASSRGTYRTSDGMPQAHIGRAAGIGGNIAAKKTTIS